MATYQYLKKPVEQASGFAPECWRVKQIQMSITGDSPYAVIRFEGYKDFDAFIAGKPSSDEECAIVVNHLDQLTTYPALFAEMMGRVLTEGALAGAEFKEVEVPDAPAE